ncbi:MAG: ZrgA family zinc uptake protein [Pseudomonadota bacterium]
MRQTRNLQALAAALALAIGAGLVEREAQAARQEAHVHGHARLQLAMEGAMLEAFFESPAVNIVGFEHQPRNDSQRERVAQAAGRLRAEPLVRLLDAEGCVVAHASVTSELIHADHGDEEHGHDHDHHHHDGGHAVFEVIQRVECDDGSLSGPVHADVMEAFEGIQQMQVEWLSDNAQGASTLTRDRMRFSID